MEIWNGRRTTGILAVAAAALVLAGLGCRPPEPARSDGVEMLRIHTPDHDVLAWVGPHFVVTFGRGQEVSDEWLEEVAGATVRAVEERARPVG